MAKRNKRQRAKKMAARGASAAKIERKTGVSSRAATRFVSRAAARSAAPAPSSSPTPTARTTPKIKGVQQGLRIAGAGGISGGELRDIRKATGMSDDKIIRNLDKVNKKLKSKDKTGISLNAGALNKAIKRGIKQRAKNPFTIFDFGQGRIGQDIMSRMGDPGSPGAMIKGQRVGAREAVEPRFLAGGMQIRPGGRERVQGFGKQYELPERFKPKDEVVDDGSNNDNGDGNGDGTTTTVEPVMPEEIPEEEVDTSLSSGAGGLDLASWATGFRRARSSRQRAGRRAQGLASQKKNPFKSWNQ